jgi:hypothetical protein
MVYSKVLLKYYLQYTSRCGETYEMLVWLDTTISKPTKEELESLWNDVLESNMRIERNQLLKDCDYTALPDYPNREAWLDYRQQLRDFPTVWSVGVPFPEKPV